MFIAGRKTAILRILLHIKCRIHKIDVLLIEFFTQKLDCLAEPLEMDDFPLAKEPNHIVYIGIVRQPQDIIISDTRLLFWERIA